MDIANTMFWGLTPALNLLEHLEVQAGRTFGDGKVEHVHILIMGGTDCRHVIKTAAKIYKYKAVVVHFYIIEIALETIIKQLLLLNIMLQPSSSLGLRFKTKLFMEVYGNILVRPQAAKYIQEAGNQLIKMITNYEYLQEMMPRIRLELQYRERDYIENILKFWYSKGPYDISSYWDSRVRLVLRSRYDSKEGAFDWDLHMRLHQVGGKQVCSQEYRAFRKSGISFSWMESEVSTPNRSMVALVLGENPNSAHYGYMGDIQTGPFIAYGLDCEDERFLQSVNGQNSYRATDVTEANLAQFFTEIATAGPAEQIDLPSHLTGQVVMKTPEKRVVQIENVKGSFKIEPCDKLLNVDLTFGTLKFLERMQFRDDYKDLFDCIYLGSGFYKYMPVSAMQNFARDGCLLTVENQRYFLNHRDKELKEFHQNLEKYLEDLEGEANPFDPLKDDYFNFIIRN